MGSTGGWNRSTSNQPAVKKGGAKAPTMWKGVAAGLAIVVPVTVLCVFFLSGGDSKIAPKEEKKSGMIEEVAPAAAPKAKEDPAPQISDHERKLKELQSKIYVDETGERRYPGGARVESPPARTIVLREPAPRIFKYRSENEIAVLLNLEPGDELVEGSVYDVRFLKDFEASLKEKIEILPEDDEETREMKQAMIETKEDLAQRMKNGEDLCEIMRQSRDHLRDCAHYYQNLRAELNRIRMDPKYSVKDVEDYIKAANEMLESKGVGNKSFKASKVALSRLDFIRAEKAKKEAEYAAKEEAARKGK